MGEPAPSPSCGLGAIEVQARYAPDSMVVSLEFYFDESGKEPSSDYFFLAGVVARASRWKKMRGPWRKVLNEPPSIDYFKMNEAVAKAGQFKGWDEAEIDKKAMALTGLMDLHAEAHLAHYCKKADYDEARRLTMEVAVPPRLDNHYLPCFSDALFAVADYMEEKPPRSHYKPLVTFDRHDETDFEAEAFLRLLVRSGKQPSSMKGFSDVSKWIENVNFRGDDKNVLPLQAADIVAWHYNSIGKRPTEEEQARPTRMQLAKLRGKWSTWSVERLINWRRMLAEYAANSIEWRRAESRKEARRRKKREKEAQS